MKISGKIIDPLSRRVEQGTVVVEGGLIKDILWGEGEGTGYIMPGLVDAHVHIESSMLTPVMFGSEIVRHGTVAAVSDPHEIANVMGIEGVRYMVKEAGKSPVKFLVGIPSCVPATPFETSGASLGPDEVEQLFSEGTGSFLAEVMNFPGIINGDKKLMDMIAISKKYGKPVDGHAPMLSGDSLKKYAEAGIGTDHECSTIEEAREKIGFGMKILIREGSAAKNFEALNPLISSDNDKVMICTDDMHPSSLKVGHINSIMARALAYGHDLTDVVRTATLNPIKHYGIPAGLLQPGDPADFIVVGDLKTMSVSETWIDGRCVYRKGREELRPESPEIINKFNCSPVKLPDIVIKREGSRYRVIVAEDGSLLTRELIVATGSGEFLAGDPSQDILKIVVKERYNDAPPQAGFIKGLGIKSGAIASSVAHDSHNIVATGADDEAIVRAINTVVKMKGGLAVVHGDKILTLPLPVAGLMSDRDRQTVSDKYGELVEETRLMGTPLKSPFMTISFMCLLVIPELKIGDKGLFSVSTFSPVPLQL